MKLSGMLIKKFASQPCFVGMVHFLFATWSFRGTEPQVMTPEMHDNMPVNPPSTFVTTK